MSPGYVPHEPVPSPGTCYDATSLLTDPDAPEGLYPFTAECATCGGFIVRSAAGMPWAHRELRGGGRGVPV
jgi:hypothetical protein